MGAPSSITQCPQAKGCWAGRQEGRTQMKKETKAEAEKPSGNTAAAETPGCSQPGAVHGEGSAGHAGRVSA